MTSRRERAALTGLASAVAYGLLLRPRLLRWGARNEEVAAPYPYACSRPRAPTAVTDFFFWEPAHWIMQTRQFANLKRRAQLSTSDDDHRNPGARSAVAMV